MPPTVSVIIPARNEENYIARTLESVRAAKPCQVDVETIVVCDSCTDRTAEVVKKFSGVKLFFVKARKPSAARNLGAKHASAGNYIFLDADTTISKSAILDIVRCLSRDKVGTLKVKPYPRLPFAQTLMFFKNLAFSMHLYPGSNGLIFCTKSLFYKVHGFDASLSKYEDGDFMHKAVLHAQYACLRTSFAETSMRRFEKKGYFSVMLYWIRVWFKHQRGWYEKGEYEVVR